MQRIIIDTDPGVDDAQAIMLAFAYPGTHVEALTTVAGNVAVERAAQNAGIILDVIGRRVPIYQGCADGLVIPTPHRAISHGMDGLGDSGYPPSSYPLEQEKAALALIRHAQAAPGEITLVAIGPLTNLAVATILEPDLPQKFKRLVVMGGAIYAQGNSWERASEYNFYCDPEGAAVVFDRWPEITLVPWETALAHSLPQEQVAKLASLDSPRAEMFRRTIRKHLLDVGGEQRLSTPDPLAMAVALEPEIVRRQEMHFVEIELSGRMTRGQTVVDWQGLTGRKPNARVVTEIDRDRFFDLMRLALA